MRASVEPVDGNRVRLSIEVDASEVADAMNATVRRLGRQVRVPGFRPGKVPRQVLEARLGGPAALRQQAVSDLLPDLYARAVAETEVDPIAPPEIDVQDAEDGGPLTVDAIVEVRPSVSVAGYQGLQVTVPSPEVSDEEIDRQIDRLREHDGELATVDRPAADGDVVTIDLHGSSPDAEDLELSDFVVEVGRSATLPGLDDALRGARAGDVRTFTVPAPPAAPDGEAPDGEATDSEATGEEPGDASAQAEGTGRTVRVEVKEVQEKVLPEVTDEWVAEVSEFGSLAELRADLAGRLRRLKRAHARMLLRERTVEALVALVSEEPPPSMVDAEVSERIHDLSHRLQERRMTVAEFLEASGRDEEALVAELRQEARRAVLLDLALRAVADAEGIVVDEDDLADAIADMAAQVGVDVATLRQRLERSGRIPAVRSERRKAKALQWLEAHVEVVDDEGQVVDRRLLEDEDAEAQGDGPVAVADGEDEAATGVGAAGQEGPLPSKDDGPAAGPSTRVAGEDA